MKIRTGFVSNSSSSSFVISKQFLSELQIDQIKDHFKLGKELGVDYRCLGKYDEWSITENEHEIEGYTGMDNFDMDDFLKKIGVPLNKVNWG